MFSIIELHAATKSRVVEALGVPQDLLHLHLGLAVYLGISLIRGKLASSTALFAILSIEGINETFDSLSGYQAGWREPLRDIATTLAWPLMIYLCARRLGRACPTPQGAKLAQKLTPPQ